MTGVMKMRLFHLILAGALLAAPSAFAQSMPFWKSYTQTGNLRDIIPSAGNDNSVATWLGKKIDVTGGKATNLDRTGGSDSGTNISAAYVAATSPLKKYLSASKTNRFTVYFGSVAKFPNIAHDVQSTLSTGDIGLYEHGTAMTKVSDTDRQAIQNTWGITGAKISLASGGGGTGMAELGCCDKPTQTNLNQFGGALPALANMNIPDSDGGDGVSEIMTDAEEAELEKSIGGIASAAHSSRSIAPVMRPDGALPDLWSTSAIYANARKLVMATGAVAVDVPPTLALSFPRIVMDQYVDEINWAIQNHLRVTLIVSPYKLGAAGCSFDPDFLQNTKEFISYLLSKGPPPTEYAVEDYCDPPTPSQYVNGSTGDSDPTSTNQVALYLSTLPVSPMGTAKPTISGGLSEADAVNQGNLYSPLNVTNMVFDAPYAHTLTSMPLNSISNLMKYNLSALGGMAYQQSSNVQISGGGIYSNSPLNITLTNGKILVQGDNADLTIAGPAGKTQLRSNDIDKYLTVYDPYTNKGGGFHFGGPKNADAAQLYAGGGTDDANSLTLSSGAEMNFTFHDAEAGSTGNFINTGVSRTTGMFAVQNFSSINDWATGFQWAPRGVSEADRPWAASSADGTIVYFHMNNAYYSGRLTTNGDIVTNGNLLTGGSLKISAGASLALGYGAGKTPTYFTPDQYGNTAISGSIKIDGSITLGRFTKAGVLGYPNPVEGMKLYDTDDHVEVTYRCPTGASCGWFPTQYGSALSN